jgi:hypothetical protein
MKLTPELLAQAVSGLNPVKERQLDLRGKLMILSPNHEAKSRAGYKIPAIENLGVSKARTRPWLDWPKLFQLTRYNTGPTRCDRLYRQRHYHTRQPAFTQTLAHAPPCEQPNILHLTLPSPFCTQSYHPCTHQ